MKNVLIVKTSSLGDVIHTLPAITDAKKALGDEIKFDWVVEEGFAQIPSMHNAVDLVIPVAIRRWRRQGWLKSIMHGEIKKFRRLLQSKHYDAIIDAQGLLKSAFITKLAKGPSFGYDRRVIKESMASFFYDHNIFVAKSQHAIVRVRQLFAQVLGYEFNSNDIDYGIELANIKKSSKPFVIFLHGTTWETKHWPEEYWCELGELLAKQGIEVKIPWGNEIEHNRAINIAKACEGEVLPKMSLIELANLMGQGKAVVSVDTGLGHLAAALSVPSISLYGPTNPRLTCTYGKNQQHLVSDLPCAPCMRKSCNYSGECKVRPACFELLTPQMVVSAIVNLK